MIVYEPTELAKIVAFEPVTVPSSETTTIEPSKGGLLEFVGPPPIEMAKSELPKTELFEFVAVPSEEDDGAMVVPVQFTTNPPVARPTTEGLCWYSDVDARVENGLPDFTIIPIPHLATYNL